MAKVLDEKDIDPTMDQVDADLDAADQGMINMGRFGPNQTAPDLSDGGRVGSARIYPTNAHKEQGKGRAAARQAWTWNGTSSLIPLAWNPDGTMHDGGRRYLYKRYCLCCTNSGFRGGICPKCARNGCPKCANGTSQQEQKLPNGKVVKGYVIPFFYLRKDDVPNPVKFYGDIDCFLESCIRRGDRGFKTEQDMRMHARTRHRMEYESFREAQQSAKADDTDTLRRELADLRKKIDARPQQVAAHR